PNTPLFSCSAASSSTIARKRFSPIPARRSPRTTSPAGSVRDGERCDESRKKGERFHESHSLSREGCGGGARARVRTGRECGEEDRSHRGRRGYRVYDPPESSQREALSGRALRFRARGAGSSSGQEV